MQFYHRLHQTVLILTLTPPKEIALSLISRRVLTTQLLVIKRSAPIRQALAIRRSVWVRSILTQWVDPIQRPGSMLSSKTPPAPKTPPLASLPCSAMTLRIITQPTAITRSRAIPLVQEIPGPV